MRRRTRASSLSSVRSLLSWNLWASTSFRRIRPTSCGPRSIKSSLAKTALPIDGYSVKHFWSSPRFPANTKQIRCGHSVLPPALSHCLPMACIASSPRRWSDSLRPSTSCKSKTPPSPAFTTFLSLPSRSPELQPARRSLRVASTTWPLARTPSFSSMPPRSWATVLAPEPGPPCRNAKCTARTVLSPTTEQRRRCTSMKFRACLMASLTSRRPTRPSSSFSKSNASASGASETTSDRTSSSANSGGITSTSSIDW
mmetsp:Transcript_26003/g.82127  ORF Transcript_26003/g.82127 Transcript_26003/m.82127 type:complete len:256 (-) Transcript_26003:847-1614(-)